MKQAFSTISLIFFISTNLIAGEGNILPVRTDTVRPYHKTSFNDEGKCKNRKLGGNPRQINNCLVFDGANDGYRQVDPQIAVGGGYVLNATNNGVIVYNKDGNVIDGVSMDCFRGGIDPKMFFDIHNQVFGFDVWVYWDKEKIKPVNISISESNNPLGAWNTYSIPSPNEVDGGAVSYSRKWIGYSFPGGEENTFVMKMDDAKAGKPAVVYFFKGSLGHPVAVQDKIDDIYFFSIEKGYFVIRKITADKKGNPMAIEVGRSKHNLDYINYPPQSPQKGTTQKTASGDRNPKNVVMQNGYIWFSQAVNCKGKSAVQWHQIKTNGKIIQTGLIASDTTNYIETSIAVNKNEDILIGFQETNNNMFISPRMAFHAHTDPKGIIKRIISLGEGEGFTDGTSWGDYSGTVIDGDNLLDMWTIQSKASKEGKGHTVISRYKIK